MPEAISRDDALTKAYLKTRTVLFTADESHGVAAMVGNIYDGSVIEVYEERKTALVCYLYGHRSCSDEVQFDNLLAAFDKERGTELTIGRFSGPSIDLRVHATA